MRHNYVSRTRCNINEIPTASLKIRAKGVTETRAAIQRGANEKVDIGHDVLRKINRGLIASLNFPMYVVNRELSRRGVEQ